MALRSLADPGGHLGPAPKAQNGLFPSLPTVDRCEFITALDDFLQMTFYIYVSVVSSYWHCQLDYFCVFLKFKISKLSSESQNLPELEC